MNREDKERVIGKVVGINSDRFTVELLSGIDNFNISGFDDIHYFAQLNSYVVLPYQNYFIVSEVSGVREKDLNVPFSNPKEQFLNKVKTGKYLEVLPIGTLKPKDENPDKHDFEFGVSVYPALYTDVLYIKEKELDAIFNIKEQTEIVCHKPKEHIKKCTCKTKRYKTLSIGTSTIFPDYEVKIDIDKFFGNHSAVLGNTGSGKSCTISSMLQNLYKYNTYSAVGSTFIVFDVNGEYEQAFSELNQENEDIEVIQLKINGETPQESLFIPHWFLNFDEWSLLLQASEKTQQPVLRNALNIASLLEGGKIEMLAFKNHIVARCCLSIWTASESPVSAGHRINALLQSYADGELSKSLLSDNNFSFKYGNFPTDAKEQNFIEELDNAIQDDFDIPEISLVKFDLKNLPTYLDIAILYEESFGNKQIRDYCSSMLTRAKSISERSDFNFLNSPDILLENYQRKILGLIKDDTDKISKKTQIILFDLNSVEDEIVEIVSCVLARVAYESIKQIKPRNSYPINLILEEAHRYISRDSNRTFLKANKIFEQISKEGRKFGLLLLVSSQRPSELSKTVLSQCSNFIVHRIQNPEDLSHIRQITPHISETILRRMPSIPTQHALIFGHSVNLPTTFKVHEAKPLPKSDNNKISINWFRQKGFSLSENTETSNEEE